VSYVRPHELQILESAEEGALAVTLTQALTVGPNTRLEFRRADDAGCLDVELPRAEYVALRDRLGLAPGSAAHLRPRRVTRFAEEAIDPR
jgi:sulfate transport system ATP-binding protein